MNRSVSASMTSIEFSLRFTRIVRHSRLCSSMMFNVLNALPSSVRIMRSSSFDFPSNRNGSSQLKFESPGQFREQISFAAVVHLINKCAFDDECTWAAVRTFCQSKPLQGGLGVAQHVCRTTNHPPIGFWRDSRNAKIIKDLTRRH